MVTSSAQPREGGSRCPRRLQRRPAQPIGQVPAGAPWARGSSTAVSGVWVPSTLAPSAVSFTGSTGDFITGRPACCGQGASVAPELATMGGPCAQFLFLHHSPERAKNPDAAGPGCVAPAPMCSAHLGQGRLGKEAVELGLEPSCDSRSLSVYTLPGVTT